MRPKERYERNRKERTKKQRKKQRKKEKKERKNGKKESKTYTKLISNKTEIKFNAVKMVHSDYSVITHLKIPNQMLRFLTLKNVLSMILGNFCEDVNLLTLQNGWNINSNLTHDFGNEVYIY